MTSQVEPKKIVVENSNVQYSPQLPLARTASVPPITEEAKINVAQSPGLNVSPPITQEKINLGQGHSLSNSSLKYLVEKPIYGTVNFKNEIKTENINTEQTQHKQQHVYLNPPHAGNPHVQQLDPQTKTEIKTEQQLFPHPDNPIIKKDETGENKPFQCQFCPRSYSSQDSRSAHIAANHK